MSKNSRAAQGMQRSMHIQENNSSLYDSRNDSRHLNSLHLDDHGYLQKNSVDSEGRYLNQKQKSGGTIVNNVNIPAIPLENLNNNRQSQQQHQSNQMWTNMAQDYQKHSQLSMHSSQKQSSAGKSPSSSNINLTGDLLAPDEGSLQQLVSIEQDVESNIIGYAQKNRMSLDFEIQEANESQEDSTILGQSSQRLRLSKRQSGEAYKQELKNRLLNSKKLNTNKYDGSKSTETNNSKSPMMRPPSNNNRDSHQSTQSKGSNNYQKPMVVDLASCIYMPTSYDKLRNKREFSEFIQSVQANLHEQSFANDEAMQRQNQMSPQLAYNFFMAYMESIICTENADSRVQFDHDKASKSVFIQLAQTVNKGMSEQDRLKARDQKKKTELQALLIESLITKQRQNQKEMQECIFQLEQKDQFINQQMQEFQSQYMQLEAAMMELKEQNEKLKTSNTSSSKNEPHLQSKIDSGSAEVTIEERFLVEASDKYNLPQSSCSPQLEGEATSKGHSRQQSANDLRQVQSTDRVLQSKEQQLQQEVQNLQKLLDVYQQNHGQHVCVQLSTLNGLGTQISKIYSFCQKNEKECMQKLKESSANPLIHLKNRDGDSSSSRSSSSDDTFDKSADNYGSDVSPNKPPRVQIRSSSRLSMDGQHKRRSSIVANSESGGKNTQATDLVPKMEKESKRILRKIKQINKFNQRIKQHQSHQQNSIENSELLDLKSELCTIKSEQLQKEQKRMKEISQKNLQISTLEFKLKEEQKSRQEDLQTKQQIIEQLEKDIEITLQSQIQEYEKLEQKYNDMQNQIQQYQLFRKDVELVFLQQSHGSDAQLKMGPTLEETLEQALKIIQSSQSNNDQHIDHVAKLNYELSQIKQERDEIKRQFEIDLLGYKAQMGEQVSQIQMQMSRERDQMGVQMTQNAELMSEVQRLRAGQQKQQASAGKEDKLSKLLIHTFREMNQILSGTHNSSSEKASQNFAEYFTKERMLAQFDRFQEEYLQILEKILQRANKRGGKDISDQRYDKILDLFEKILKKIENISDIKKNPNGNIQFIIAQLGPILQRISDQLCSEKFDANSVERPRRSGDIPTHIRSETPVIKSRKKLLDSNQLNPSGGGGTRLGSGGLGHQENNYSRFCLSLIKQLKNHFNAQSAAANTHRNDNGGQSRPSEAIMQQNKALTQRLMLAEKLLKLRSFEINDSIDFIVRELESHLENLKGDFLTQIINRIKNASKSLKVCDSSQYCVYTMDVGKNHLQTICQEIMKTFSTLLKQLQGTQKQMIKLQKKQKGGAEATVKDAQSPQNVQTMHAARASSHQKVQLKQNIQHTNNDLDHNQPFNNTQRNLHTKLHNDPQSHSTLDQYQNASFRLLPPANRQDQVHKPGSIRGQQPQPVHRSGSSQNHYGGGSNSTLANFGSASTPQTTQLSAQNSHQSLLLAKGALGDSTPTEKNINVHYIQGSNMFQHEQQQSSSSFLSRRKSQNNTISEHEDGPGASGLAPMNQGPLQTMVSTNGGVHVNALNERQRTRSNMSSFSYLGSAASQSQTASHAHLQYSKESYMRSNQTADFKDNRMNTHESSHRGDLAYHVRKGSQNPPGSPWMANR